VTGECVVGKVLRAIFERYGGFAKISQVVSSFYDKMLDSPVTSPFFAKTDMKRLIDHQTKFIASVMGRPVSYTNEYIERVHTHLTITNKAYDEAMEMLIETLEDFDFEPDDIQVIEDEMKAHMHYVVSRN
jgi:hemoglobin